MTNSQDDIRHLLDQLESLIGTARTVVDELADNETPDLFHPHARLILGPFAIYNRELPCIPFEQSAINDIQTLLLMLNLEPNHHPLVDSLITRLGWRHLCPVKPQPPDDDEPA